MIRNQLKTLGMELPPTPEPVASYIPAKEHNHLLYISGQLPFKGEDLIATGILKNQSDIEKGTKAMEQCFLNALAAANSIIDIDQIKGVLKLTAFVASAPEFVYQHLVANGASQLANKIFEDNGKHVRSAIGVPSLPLNASVELEVIFII